VRSETLEVKTPEGSMLCGTAPDRVGTGSAVA
jgi:hypothetical protein